jgi:Protein of unknown function (DUF2786)
MGTIETVIEKVKKLRRLAGSSNEHEAAAAAAAADRLIQEHALVEAQLEADGASGERPSEDPEPIASWHGTVPQWQARLAVKLAKHYGCALYGQRIRGSRTTTEHIVGRPSDIAAVRYMYTWLALEIEGLAQKHRGNGRTWLNAFRHGAVVGVLAAMTESRRAAQVGASTAAIVLVDRKGDEALAARNATHTDLQTKVVGNPTNLDGVLAGRAAGRNLHEQSKHGALDSAGSRALGSKR